MQPPMGPPGAGMVTCPHCGETFDPAKAPPMPMPPMGDSGAGAMISDALRRVR